MKKLVIALSCAAIAGCAITAESIASYSTTDLCRSYGAPLNSNYMSTLVRDELIKRGASHCVDPNFIAAQQARSMEMLGLGVQLLNQSQPQPMYQPR